METATTSLASSSVCYQHQYLYLPITEESDWCFIIILPRALFNPHLHMNPLEILFKCSLYPRWGLSLCMFLCVCFLILTWGKVYWFSSERKGERDRGIDMREKHRLVASHTCPCPGSNPQPSSVPWCSVMENRSNCLLLWKPMLKRQGLMWRKVVYLQMPAIWKMGDSCPKAHLHLSVEAEAVIRRERGTEQRDQRREFKSSLRADEHSLFRYVMVRCASSWFSHPGSTSFCFHGWRPANLLGLACLKVKVYILKLVSRILTQTYSSSTSWHICQSEHLQRQCQKNEWWGGLQFPVKIYHCYMRIEPATFWCMGWRSDQLSNPARARLCIF